jgi:drug/metabolite transporter (DMT)-like permease
MMASVAAALGAAVSFALAAVTQQEATQETELDSSLTPRLLLRLARRPKWLAGVTLLVVGFGLQTLALANGPVALVQPIVVTELAFAIPLAVWRHHRRAGRREWIGIACVLGGIAAFLVVAAPAAGTAEASGLDWVLTVTPIGCAIAALTVIAAAARGPYRATLLGAAAGLSFGLLAILTKAVTAQLSHGMPATFTNWQIYAVVALGICALVVSQSAYQAGPLALSLPAIALLEPVVAVVTGDMLFEEQARLTGAALATEAGCALVAAAGIAVLATSPIVLSIYQQTETSEGKPMGESREVHTASQQTAKRHVVSRVNPAPRPRPPTRGTDPGQQAIPHRRSKTST